MLAGLVKGAGLIAVANAWIEIWRQRPIVFASGVGNLSTENHLIFLATIKRVWGAFAVWSAKLFICLPRQQNMDIVAKAVGAKN